MSFARHPQRHSGLLCALCRQRLCVTGGMIMFENKNNSQFIGLAPQNFSGPRPGAVPAVTAWPRGEVRDSGKER